MIYDWNHKYPFLGMALSMTIGILLCSVYPISWSVLVCSFAFLIPILWLKRGTHHFLFFWLFALILFGMFQAKLHNRSFENDIARYANQINQLERTSKSFVWLQGKVIDLPERKKQGGKNVISFILDTESLFHRTRMFPERHQVTGRTQVFIFYQEVIPMLGDIVRVRGELREPDGASNEGQFDYKNFLSHKGVNTVFTAYGKKSLKIMSRGDPLSFQVILSKVRYGLAARIEKVFDNHYEALLKALLVGMRKNLSPDLRDAFMKTGTAHLLAISGLHMTLVAGFVYGGLLFVKVSRKWAALLSLFAVGFYVFVSGAAIPAQRAGWISVLFFLGVLLQREMKFLNALAFAYLIILINFPNNIYSLSFQLSFLSVFSFFFFFLSFRIESSWKRYLLRSGVALLGTLPIVLFHFNILSWISVLANAIVVPVFHVGLIASFFALLMADIPYVGTVFVATTQVVFQLGIFTIERFSSLKWGYSYFKSPHAIQIFFYYALLLMVIGLRTVWKEKFSPLRPWVVGTWCLVLFLFFLPPKQPDFYLTLLSMGKNHVIHLQFDRYNHWLINVGRSKPSNQARWIVLPYLRSLGVNHLQGIVIGSEKKRYYGALGSLLKGITTDYIFYPRELEEVMKQMTIQHKVNRVFMHSYDEWTINEENEIEALHMESGEAVLSIQYRDLKVLYISSWDLVVWKELMGRLWHDEVFQVIVFPEKYGDLTVEQLSDIRSLAMRLRSQLLLFPSLKQATQHALKKSQDFEVFDANSFGALKLFQQKEQLFLHSVGKGPVFSAQL